MAGQRVEVRGLSTMIANFRSFDRQLRAEMQQANEESMEAVVEDAKAHAPVRTGMTRDAITGELSEQGLTYTAFVDEAPFKNAGLAYYPQFVHNGTRFIAANPFLLSAFVAEHPRYLVRVRQAGRRSLSRFGG